MASTVDPADPVAELLPPDDGVLLSTLSSNDDLTCWSSEDQLERPRNGLAHSGSFVAVEDYLARNSNLVNPCSTAFEVVCTSSYLQDKHTTADSSAPGRLFHDIVGVHVESQALIEVINVQLQTGRKFPLTGKPLLQLAPFTTFYDLYEGLQAHLSNLQEKFAIDQCTTPHEQSARKRNVTTTDKDSPLSKKAYLDLRCFLNFFRDTVLPWWVQVQRKELTDVSFDELVALYHPGELVVHDGAQHMFRIAGISGGRQKLVPAMRRVRVPRTKHQDTARYEDFAVDHLDDWTPLSLFCYHIQHDGQRFRVVRSTLTIKPFRGRRGCRMLRPYPERFITKALRNACFEEGLCFYDMTDPTRSSAYYKYTGRTLNEDFSGRILSKSGRERDVYSEHFDTLQAMDVDSDVVVDIDLAYMNNPTWLSRNTEDYTIPKTDETTSSILDSLWISQLSVEFTDVWERHRLDDYVASDPWLQKPVLKANETLDMHHRSLFKADERHRQTRRGLNDNLLLLPNRIFGYVLRDRHWACFDLSERAKWAPVKPDHTAWNEMQIHESHRHHLLALVDRHFRNQEHSKAQVNHVGSFDVIQGKGRGVIILLHGAPGVGKTATAESIAKRFGKPLLPMTCGSLGTDSYLEEALKNRLELAERWGCVVLLDEADVFLARREKSDVNRNAIVSIFLSTLEYFTGVLFLTTNRTGDFDEAFTSRIHLALWYPDLGPEATHKIWENNIKRLQNQAQGGSDAVIVKEDGAAQILRYAAKHRDAYRVLRRSPWNGRQIRNAFQTAVALAAYEAAQHSPEVTSPGAVLDWKHFRKVAISANNFDSYLAETRGKTEDQIAAEFALRAKFNAYASTVGNDLTARAAPRKWRKISMSKAHEMIMSVHPDQDLVEPLDLFEKDTDDADIFGKIVSQPHAQSASPNAAPYRAERHNAPVPQPQQYMVAPGDPRTLYIPGQQPAYPATYYPPPLVQGYPPVAPTYPGQQQQFPASAPPQQSQLGSPQQLSYQLGQQANGFVYPQTAGQGAQPDQNDGARLR